VGNEEPGEFDEARLVVDGDGKGCPMKVFEVKMMIGAMLGEIVERFWDDAE
jgi:hypothetical protein